MMKKSKANSPITSVGATTSNQVMTLTSSASMPQERFTRRLACRATQPTDATKVWLWEAGGYLGK
jgi:hypothetical protein